LQQILLVVILYHHYPVAQVLQLVLGSLVGVMSPHANHCCGSSGSSWYGQMAMVVGSKLLMALKAIAAM